MKQAASHLATRRALPGVVRRKVYKKKGGARELLAKEEKGLASGWNIFFSWGRERGGFSPCGLPLLSWGAEGSHVTGYLPGTCPGNSSLVGEDYISGKGWSCD